MNGAIIRRAAALVLAVAQATGALAADTAAPAPARPPAETLARPDVFIGYKRAPALFSGLVPGYIGLWQLNVAVPPDAPVGAAVPVIVNQGITSNALLIAVEAGAAR